MRQFNTSIHKEMSAYLMDFGFGGFIGYGKGVFYCECDGRAE